MFPQPKPNTPRKPTNYNKNLFTDDFAKSFSSVEATNLGDQFKYYNKNKNGKTKIMNYTTETIKTTKNLNNSGNPRKNINTTENLIKNEKYYNTMLRQFKKFKIIGEEQYKKMKKLFDEFKFNKSILDKIKFTS